MDRTMKLAASCEMDAKHKRRSVCFRFGKWANTFGLFCYYERGKNLGAFPPKRPDHHPWMWVSHGYCPPWLFCSNKSISTDKTLEMGREKEILWVTRSTARVTDWFHKSVVPFFEKKNMQQLLPVENSTLPSLFGRLFWSSITGAPHL